MNHEQYLTDSYLRSRSLQKNHSPDIHQNPKQSCRKKAGWAKWTSLTLIFAVLAHTGFGSTTFANDVAPIDANPFATNAVSDRLEPAAVRFYVLHETIAKDPIYSLLHSVYLNKAEQALKDYGAQTYDQLPPHVFSGIVGEVNEVGRELHEFRDAANGYAGFSNTTNSFLPNLIGGIGALRGGASAVIYSTLGVVGATKFMDDLENHYTNHKQAEGQQWMLNTNPVPLNYAADAAYVLRCSTAACKDPFDGIISHKMFGIRIGDNGATMASKSPILRTSLGFAAFSRQLKTIESQLKTQGDDIAALEKIHGKSNLLFSSINDQLATLQNVVKEAIQNSLRPPADIGVLKTTIADIDAGFQVTQTVAMLLGHSQTAQYIGQAQQITMGFLTKFEAFQQNTATLTQVTNFAMTSTSVVTAINAIQLANSILNKQKGPTAEQAIMSQLQAIAKQIQQLHETVVTGFLRTNAHITFSTNRLSLQLDVIEKKIDLISGYVDTIYNLERKNIYSNFRLMDNSRSEDLREMAEECVVVFVSKSAMDICRRNLLRFGTTRATYALLPVNFTESEFYIDVLDSRYPYFAHLPYLSNLMDGVVNDRSGFANPRDWGTAARAYVQMIGKNPTVRNPAEVVADLDRFIYYGKASVQMIRQLNFESNSGAYNHLREAAHLTQIDTYRDSLMALASDRHKDGGTNQLGRNNSYDLTQPVTKIDEFHNLFVERNADPTIRVCSDAPDTNFLIEPVNIISPQYIVYLDRMKYRTDADYNAALLRAAKRKIDIDWNRRVIENKKLKWPASDILLKIIPPRYIWAQLANLGKVELCFAKYRPTYMRFWGTGSWNPYHARFHLKTDIELSVRFVPNQQIMDAFNGNTANSTIRAIAINNFAVSSPQAMWAIRYDGKGGCPFPDCLGKIAKTIWESKAKDDGNWHGVKPNVLPNSPISKFIQNGAKSVNTRIQDLERAVDTAYWKANPNAGLMVKNDLVRRQSYMQGSDQFRAYYAIAMAGLGQIVEENYSIDNIFGPLGLPTPNEFVTWMTTQRPSPTQTVDAINARTEFAKNQIRKISDWYQTLPDGHHARRPYAAGMAQDQLDNLIMLKSVMQAQDNLH